MLGRGPRAARRPAARAHHSAADRSDRRARPPCEVRATLPAVGGRRRAHRAVGRVPSGHLPRPGPRPIGVRLRRTAPFDVAHVVYLNPFTDAFDLRGLAHACRSSAASTTSSPTSRGCPRRSSARLLQAQYRTRRDARRAPRRGAAAPARGVRRRPGSGGRGPAADRRGADPPLARRRARRRSCSSARSGATRASTCCSRRSSALRGETDARFVLRGPGLPGRRGRGDRGGGAGRAHHHRDRVRDRRPQARAVRRRGPRGAARTRASPRRARCSRTRTRTGCRCVVSDVGALGETVREDRTGWVVAPGDADELAATLLARDPRRRRPRRDAAAGDAVVAERAHAGAGSGRSCARCTSVRSDGR